MIVYIYTDNLATSLHKDSCVLVYALPSNKLKKIYSYT